MLKTIKLTILSLLCVVYGFEAFSQIGLAVKLGGNLSHANGLSFRSSNRLGFQVGGVLRYYFHSNMAIQAEPTFHLSRIRANSATLEKNNGIKKGNKALHSFGLPVLFKLNVTPSFALLGGVEFDKLLNTEEYLLNNGEQAFKGGYRTGYSFGAEMGKIYFRYRSIRQGTRIYNNWNADIQQYQFGVKWNIF